MSTRSGATEAKPRTIVVASHNPVKISAAVEGFSAMFRGSTFSATGVSVPSGVPDQPWGDAETLQGARNRAEGARALEPDADIWVGIEGGLLEEGGEADGPNKSVQSFAWVVVLEGSRTGKARTAAYFLPEETAQLVRSGLELGKAEDLVWGKTNTKQKNGSVGLLTGDVIDRKNYYVQAVILSLIPMKNRNLTFL